MPMEVTVAKGEPVEKALRRLKKRLEREEVLIDARKKRYNKKPSEVKREKKKVMDFTNMLRVRYEKM